MLSWCNYSSSLNQCSETHLGAPQGSWGGDSNTALNIHIFFANTLSALSDLPSIPLGTLRYHDSSTSVQQPLSYHSPCTSWVSHSDPSSQHHSPRHSDAESFISRLSPLPRYSLWARASHRTLHHCSFVASSPDSWARLVWPLEQERTQTSGRR